MLATEAQALSENKLRLDKIVTYIKVSAEKGWFQISYRLHKDEIKCLKELGYIVTPEACGNFNISWFPKHAIKSKVEKPKTKPKTKPKMVKWFRHSKQSLICCKTIPTKWKRVERQVADVDGMVTIMYKSYSCGVCKKAVMPLTKFIAPNRMYSKRFIKMAVRLMREAGSNGASKLIKKATGIIVGGSTIHNWNKERSQRV